MPVFTHHFKKPLFYLRNVYNTICTEDFALKIQMGEDVFFQVLITSIENVGSIMYLGGF